MNDFNVQKIRNNLGFTGSHWKMFLRWCKRQINHFKYELSLPAAK